MLAGVYSNLWNDTELLECLQRLICDVIGVIQETFLVFVNLVLKFKASGCAQVSCSCINAARRGQTDSERRGNSLVFTISEVMA